MIILEKHCDCGTSRRFRFVPREKDTIGNFTDGVFWRVWKFSAAALRGGRLCTGGNRR